AAHGVGNIRAESLPAESLRGNGLLAVVKPVAVLVLRADYHRAGGADRRNFVAGDGAVNAQHVHVITQDLEVVFRPVARRGAFVLQHRPALVGGHGEMAAETTGGPRAVAAEAGHAVVGMGEAGKILRNGAPSHAILQKGLRQPRFFTVVRISRSDGVL